MWAEIARALAARIGVQVVLLEHPTPPKAVDCLKAGACDLLFCRSTLGPPTSATSRPQFSNSTIPYWCRLAPHPQRRRRRPARGSHRGRAQSRLDLGSEPFIEASRTGVRRDPRPHFRPAAHRTCGRDGISPPDASSFSPSCPVHGCWRTATGRTSTGWWFRRARQDGSTMSASSSRRPRLRAWCRRPLTALARAGPRWPRREIPHPAVSVSWKRNQGSLKSHGTN